MKIPQRDLTYCVSVSTALGGEVHINIERGDGLLVDSLIRNKFAVYVTAPVVTHHRRPRRAKDDRGDAYLLASLLRVGDVDCRRLTQRSEVVEHLRQLIRAYDNMVQAQRKHGNRITYLLKQYYPAALKVFCQPYRLIALAFLERYPTPEAAREATIDDLRMFLKENRYPGKKHDQKVEEMYRILQAPEPTALHPDGFVRHVEILIPLLRHIYRNRRSLEREIIQVLPTHPDAAFWLQFPGSQRLTAARLLAWIGDDRERFPSPDVLQAVAGTAPVTRRSGKSRSVEFRTACSHKLRKTIDDFTRQSVKKSKWAKDYYDQQISRGHSSARAYRALGNRWLRILWKLWRTNGTYDEALHEANRSAKGRAAEMKHAS